MKYWTIQSKEVLNKIESEGIYYPNIERSNYISKNVELEQLYTFILDSFNSVNKCKCSGLVFSFLTQDSNKIVSYENITSFHNAMIKGKDIVNPLWNELLTNECKILELEFDEEINPIYIDFNDFQIIMPPIYEIQPYKETDIKKIITNVRKGVFSQSIFPSKIIQGHLPYIKTENILNTHELFLLNK